MRVTLVSSSLVLLLAACSGVDRDNGTSGVRSKDGGTDDVDAGETDAGEVDAGTPGECAPTAVRCEDQIIQALNLQKTAAPGLITSAAYDGWFDTKVDATAGGAFTATPHSYVYGKFTNLGLEKVAISDEDALASMDWDIAFRRYVIRINSGVSGPSCVTAFRVPGAATTFDSVTSVPETFNGRTDDYFTESCEVVPDGSGLPGAPSTALASYWTYPNCVKMSGHVYVLQLRSGRHLKLEVKEYYGTNQDSCQTSGSPGTGSANMRMSWAYLD